MTMLNSLIIVLAVALLCGLLLHEKKEGLGGRVFIKAPLSCLFILAAVMQPHPVPVYYHLLLPGLVFCLGGDVFLALPQKRMFLFGLIFFLIGHVFYMFAFFRILDMSQMAWMGSAVFLLVSLRIFFWLAPNLEKMKVPVMIYMAVITLMIMGAWSLLCDVQLPRTARIQIFSGALLFYVSDLFVARNRFLKKEFFNRLAGLPLYYAGQFLLAFSVGLL